jgi:hypothetical protein
VRAQEPRREFQGQKTVQAVGAAACAQPLDGQGVDSDLIGADEPFRIAVLQGSDAGKIQADFQAAGMEGPPPIQIAREAEVVPLDAPALLDKVAVQSPPGSVDGSPGSFLGRGDGRWIWSSG